LAAQSHRNRGTRAALKRFAAWQALGAGENQEGESKMRERSILSVAMLAIALAIGCSSKANDAALVTSIQSQMFSDQQLRGASLQVTSDHGQVTLSGTVPTDAARLDAFKIATQTPGVSKVNDQITVEVPPAPQAEIVRPPAGKHDRAAMKAGADKKKKKHQPVPDDAESAYNAPLDDPQPPAAAAPAEAPAAQPDPAPAPAPAPVLPPAPPPPVPVQVAADTTLAIRMIDGIDSSVNHAGEIFHASLDAPIVVNDEVLVPKGADVYVRLASASSAGRYSGKSELHLELVKLEFRGQSYPLVSSTYSLAGGSQGKGTAEKVGGGAVIGAIIGAIAGGGRGAAIGAGVGGAGGGIYQGATGSKQVKIPSETRLDFQLGQPVTINAMPRSVPTAE
jgi:hypothetical protein